MNTQGYLVQGWDVFPQTENEIAEFIRGGIAHGIGDIYGGCTHLDDLVDHPTKIFKISARGIFGGIFHIRAETFGIFD